MKFLSKIDHLFKFLVQIYGVIECGMKVKCIEILMTNLPSEFKCPMTEMQNPHYISVTVLQSVYQQIYIQQYINPSDLMNHNIDFKSTTPCQTGSKEQKYCCLCTGRLNYEYRDALDPKPLQAVLKPSLVAEFAPAVAKSDHTFAPDAEITNFRPVLRSWNALDTTRSKHARRALSKFFTSNNLIYWRSMIQGLKGISNTVLMDKTIEVLLESFTSHNIVSEPGQLETFGQQFISHTPYDASWSLVNQSTQLEAICAYVGKILIRVLKTEMGCNKNSQIGPSSLLRVSKLPRVSKSLKRELIHKTKTKARSFTIAVLKKVFIDGNWQYPLCRKCHKSKGISVEDKYVRMRFRAGKFDNSFPSAYVLYTHVVSRVLPITKLSRNRKYRWDYGQSLLGEFMARSFHCKNRFNYTLWEKVWVSARKLFFEYYCITVRFSFLSKWCMESL